MPRQNNGTEIYRFLNTVQKIVPQATTPGSTTTTAPVVVGDLVVAVVASTNFTAADLAIITGSGGMEVVTIGTPATSMPITRPAKVAQDTGATFVEAVASSLLHIAQGGITFGGSATDTDILASTSRTAVAVITGAATLTWSIPLLGHNNPNLQAIFGVTEGETGAGTAADPYAAVISGTTIGTQVAHAYRSTGVDFAGRLIEIDFLGCSVTINNSVTVGGTTSEGMTVTGRANTIIQRIWTV